jgi:hypothetical protein
MVVKGPFYGQQVAIFVACSALLQNLTNHVAGPGRQHGCCDLVDEGTHGLALAEVALRAMGLNGVGLTYGALTHW